MVKLSLGLSSLNDGNLEFAAKEIVTAMSNNAWFKNPDPEIATVQDALTAYSDSRVAAAQGGPAARAVKNTRRKELIELLVLLGLWIMGAAKGNEIALASCGYKMYKKPEPRYLVVPEATLVTPGLAPGQLQVEIGAVYGATGYQYFIAEALAEDKTVWQSEPFGQSRYVFTNLQQGKQYWVKVGVTGPRKQQVYSPVASSYVL